METKVTVGFAVYNGERFLARSLDSVLGQSYRDFCVVIRDNASTDGTGDICRRYAKDDQRIQYYRNPTNIGMAGNYNLLFGHCRTKYFRWSTADDFVSPDMLGDAVEVMERDESLSLCYPQATFVDAEGRETGRWADDLHLMQDDPVDRFCTVVGRIGRVHHHLGLMRADLVRQTMLIKPHPGADLGFVAEMSLRGKFNQIPKSQYFRRLHEESSSWKPDDRTHQIQRFHEAGSRGLRFVAARVQGTYWQAVARSGLGVSQRARAYAFPARHAMSIRDELLSELRRDLES